MNPSCSEIVDQLQSLANPANVAGMARYGISSNGTLGVSIYELRRIAKGISPDHDLALELWQTGIHEARILAALVDEPAQVTEEQMESWVLDFDSWDVCDQVSTILFDRTPLAYAKALEWSERSEEFVKRAGFVLMAGLAVHDRKAQPEAFEPFFEAIQRQAHDDRNFVKKGVNWALRNLGKRSRALNARAIQVAQAVQASGSRPARWIAADALRELQSEKVQQRLKT
jgi:3-methyladenine DNA glycosylase AlkD